MPVDACFLEAADMNDFVIFLSRRTVTVAVPTTDRH